MLDKFTVHALEHYLTMVMKQAGLTVDSDTRVELAGIMGEVDRCLDKLDARITALEPANQAVTDEHEQAQQERIDSLATSWQTPNGLMTLTRDMGTNWVVLWIEGNRVVKQERLGANTLQDALAELSSLIAYNKKA